MILHLLCLLLAQEPAPQPTPPAPEPEAAPAVQDPTPKPPSRSREDRLEGRISGEPQPAAPAVETPVAPVAPVTPAVEDPSGRKWKPLNKCALIVNEEMVTMLEVDRGATQSRRRQKQPMGVQESLELEVTRRAREMLETQGGKDFGYDPEQVERFVNREMERQVEEAGSVTKLAANLKDLEQDSFARRDEVYAHIHTYLWQQSVTGQAPGPGGRVFRDRFPRPGRLLFEHAESVATQAKRPMVVMTQLILILGDPVAPGGDQRVIDRLKELRERVENGEDMGELAEQHGALPRGTRGVSQRLAIPDIRKSNPEVAQFLEQAKVGDLSPPLPYYEQGKRVGYIVVRPDEMGSPPLPPFADAVGQRYWTETYRMRLDERRIQVGLSNLLSAAYVWPPQTFGNSEESP